MAYLSIIPQKIVTDNFFSNGRYRGKYQHIIDLPRYKCAIGNNSFSLLENSYACFDSSNLIAFDTSPWAINNVLPSVFKELEGLGNKTIVSIKETLSKIKVDFQCILIHRGQPYVFRSLVSNRPLFYSNSNGEIIASNALKSIQKALNARIDSSKIAEFIIPQYSNPATTIWANIYRLRPGFSITTDFNQQCFQCFDDHYEVLSQLSVEQIVDTLKHLFFQAIERSTYGNNIVLLSGGIDSSSIVCTLLQKDKKTTAFSLVYENALRVCDEKKYVDAIIEKYELDVKRLVADEIVPLSKTIDDTDEPELWPYTIRNYELLSLIKNHYDLRKEYVNVIAGEGGDELLLGQVFSLFERFKHLSWGDGISELLYDEKHLKDNIRIISLLNKDYYDSEECISERIQSDIPSWIASSYIDKHSIKEKMRLSYPRFSSTDRMTSKYSQFLFSKMGAAGQVECGGWHEDEILRFGLNASYPFLDYELVEFVWSLPAQYLRYQAKEKWVLREALKDFIPQIILERTDKTEATPMLDKGLHDHFNELLRINEDSLLCKLGVIRSDEYKKALYLYIMGRSDLKVPLWATYTVEKWLERNREYL